VIVLSTRKFLKSLAYYKVLAYNSRAFQSNNRVVFFFADDGYGIGHSKHVIGHSGLAMGHSGLAVLHASIFQF
jgi:hypothetical protein